MVDPNSPKECPLCSSTDARIGSYGNRDAFEIECRRCGHFAVTRPLLYDFRSLSDSESKLLPYLSAHTKQSAQQSPDVIELTRANWKEFAELHSSTRVPEKADKLLMLCAKRTNVAGVPVQLDPELDYPLIDAVSSRELRYLFEYLVKSGYLEADIQIVEVTPSALVTVPGWKKLEVPLGGIAGHCFVAMSFDKKLDSAYDLGIKPAVMTDCKLPEPIRMDREKFNEKICDRIIADIRTCQFIVADFTQQKTGVFF